MEIRKSSRLFACAGFLALALLSGCGSSTTTIPTSATVLYSHTLILRNYSAMTLGYNGFGQLGDGTLNSRAEAVFVPGLGHLVGGATGAEHTIVFGNNSSVMAWGYNLYGQLGSAAISTVGTAAYCSTPVKVPLHGIVSAVAAGGFHSLAVANGSVYGWGYNGFGQVGDGTFVNAVIPVQVKNQLDGTFLGTLPQAPAMQVAAGGSHSLALLGDGTVYAWGSNVYGEIGIDPASINGSYSQNARQLTVRHVEQIAAAGSYSLALENDRDPAGNLTGQTLWGWGYNQFGQLGQDPTAMPYSYQPVKLFTAPGPSGSVVTGDTIVIKKVSAGLDHLLLLMGKLSNDGSDGSWTVQSIGLNSLGQLGDETIVNSFTLVQVLSAGTANPSLLFAGATDIIAFGNMSLARVGSSPGTWYGWGDNGYGQLGNPISTTSIGYLLIPQLVQLYAP